MALTQITGTGIGSVDSLTPTTIFLGGSGSANALDDYEEGTWTPQIWKGTTQVTSPTTVYGIYRKIGSILVMSFYFYKSSGSNTDSGGWILKGFPFALLNAAVNGYPMFNPGYTGINSVNYFDQSGSHRWQANSSTACDLYGPQYNTNWTTGHIEFAGNGVFYV